MTWTLYLMLALPVGDVTDAAYRPAEKSPPIHLAGHRGGRGFGVLRAHRYGCYGQSWGRNGCYTGGYRSGCYGGGCYQGGCYGGACYGGARYQAGPEYAQPYGGQPYGAQPYGTQRGGQMRGGDQGPPAPSPARDGQGVRSPSDLNGAGVGQPPGA